ncbi:uncharacterized protein JN550_011408 [Neoarthrinium moseri]|nr:uncharacterized protein JN550_011408 [Neoarthrinium moseri]KAI1860683.1 hypothetical protein JN550_011408 [Neoarthrinium moseri]
MANTGLERSATFLTEVWTLFAIGILVLFARFAVRIKTVGLRGLQGDDLFALIIVFMYTGDAVLVHLVYLLGSNVDAATFQRTRPLSDEEVAQYRIGSICQFTAWFTYSALLWSLKGVMLCFFKRLTMGLWQARLTNWLMWICAGSYFVVLLTVIFTCFPTDKNWQVVPDPGLKCTFRSQNFIVTAILNVITDLAILAIPVPILWQLQVSWKKKLFVGILICSGFFVIAAAIVRVTLTVGANPSGTNVNRWGVRETLVGIIAANLPVLGPVTTKKFWNGGRLTSRRYSKTTIGGRSSSTWHHSFRPYGVSRSFAASIGGHKNRNNSFAGSEESIFHADNINLQPTSNEVLVHTSYHVKTEDNVGGASDGWAANVTTPETAACRGPDAV